MVRGTVTDNDGYFVLTDVAAGLVNEGTGTNLGVDISLERYFRDDWYYMFTGSVYRSQNCCINGFPVTKFLHQCFSGNNIVITFNVANFFS